MPPYAFSGSVPEIYESAWGPVLFEPYARETARRVATLKLPGHRWLELAAGTGRLTRHLTPLLPPGGSLLATDLQPEMLRHAEASLDDPRLRFEAADAQDLPYGSGDFDLVLSQFGAMFYRDKARAHAEANRVLGPGGAYLFTTWQGHEANPWAAALDEIVAETFPDEQPAFFRAPFSYNDEAEIRRDLRAAGFAEVSIEQVLLPFVAPDALTFARGAVAGTPFAQGLAERGVDPDDIIPQAAQRLAGRFGDRPMRCPMGALLILAKR